MAELENIYQTYHTRGVPTLKIYMFEAWLNKSPDASWKELVKALRNMDKSKVASDIERDYIKGT